MNHKRETHVRPATGTVRREQLRLAKRRQREREKHQGLVTQQLRLPRRLADKLKAGNKRSEFTAALNSFIDDHVLCLDDYENLSLLAWNRSSRFLTRCEAFQLYERNWRHVDTHTLSENEQKLIDDLAREYGRGIILA